MFVLKPLLHRPIRLLWSGQVLSAIGDEVYKVALIWAAVSLVGAKAGYLGALQSGAILVVGLFSGVLADAWDHRKTLIGVDLVRAVVVLIPPIYSLWHSLSVWILILVAFIVSSLSALFDPALQAVLPEITKEPKLLQATNGLFDSTRRFARIIGPAMVGALQAVVPFVQFFTINSLSFILSALSLRAVKTAATAKSLEKISIGQSLRAGWQCAQRQPIIRYALFSSAVVWALWSLAFNLGLALLIHQDMPGQVSGLGLVISAYGVGNVISNLILGSVQLRRPERVMFVGLLVIGVGFIALAFTRSLPLMMAASAFAALGGPMDDLSFLTVLQRSFGGRDIARIYRLMLSICHGSTLLIFLLSPSIFKRLPIEGVIAASGLIIAFVGVGGLGRFWHYVEPAPVG